MRDLTTMMHDLHRLKASLAFVQDKLMGARAQRRSVRDQIAARCISGDQETRRLTKWRTMTADEVAWLDAVHTATAPVLTEYQPQEATLKEAVRLAENEVEAAKKQAIKTPREPGGEPGKTGEKPTSPVHIAPKGSGDRGRSPRFPPHTGENRGTRSVPLGAMDEWLER